MFEALSSDGFVCRFYDKADSHSMVRFLRELRRKYGRMVIFTDNAGIHKARDVLDFVRECRGDVVIRHYPSYTPQLNKVENQWLNIRRFTANRLFGSLDEAKKFIRRGLWNRQIKIVEISDYLR